MDGIGVSDWLDPEIHERKALEEIMQPCPNEWLSAVEISPLVNSPKNNTPEVLHAAVSLPTISTPQGHLFEEH